jgi:peptidylprolyl isomerase
VSERVRDDVATRADDEAEEVAELDAADAEIDADADDDPDAEDDDPAAEAAETDDEDDSDAPKGATVSTTKPAAGKVKGGRKSGKKSGSAPMAVRNRSPRAERRAEQRRIAARKAARRRIVQRLVGTLVVLAIAGAAFGVYYLFHDNPATRTSKGGSLDKAPVVTAGTGDVSELKVTTLIQGDGPEIKIGQQITINYTGVTYRDGKQFDSTWKTDPPQPATFQIGVGGLIKGWDQGLPGVKVGSRVQLDIPASLGYGDNPQNGAPGGPLRFVVDIISAQ